MPCHGNILIIGAGLSGLSAAYHLKKNCIVLEKEKAAGGAASSETVDGFTFDKGGHLLHFKTRYAKDLLCKLSNDTALTKHRRSSWIFSKGTYTRYPFQVNTYNLPPAVIKECLFGVIEAKTACPRKEPPRNFKEWILDNFGEGVASHFMFPYNRKLWRFPLDRMDIDWAGKFIPKTDVKQAVKGAFSDYKKIMGYNKNFYYPSKGGMQRIADGFANSVKADIGFGKEAVKICLKEKKVILKDGKSLKFNVLISTIPMPELIKTVEDLPLAIKRKIQRLKYVSVFNLNLGVGRERISDKHWIYFPEKNYIFYRVGFLSNFSKNIAPKGSSSLYIEVSYTRDKPLRYNKGQLIKRIIADLIKARILTAGDKIVAQKSYDIKYAYPLHDTHRKYLVGDIKEFLMQHNIFSIGRYGGWQYVTMEECILEGKSAADAVNCS